MPTSLSPHFTLEEMTFSQTATRMGINNVADPTITEALKTLCTNILEPLRDMVGKPVHVSSGFRCPNLNRAIGGAHNSQHMQGEAADIHVEGYTTQALFDLIRESTLPYDQLIQEFDSWVHVSFDNSLHRREALYASRTEIGHVIYSTHKPNP